VAPPAASPKSGGSVSERLTRKVGPLPVWAWAAALLAAYFLYTRMTAGKSAAAPAPASTGPADTTGTDSSGQVSAGFDQVQAGIDANTASLDSLTSALLSAAPPSVDSGAAPGGSSQTGPASSPTPPAATAAAHAGHLTQTAAGTLSWGGVTFTTKAAFNRWATAHHTTPAKEFAAHPQAKAIYSTLR
jgi:hypothetical protein